MSGLLNRDPGMRDVALGTPEGFLAFGLGTGLFRFAPGTMGTALAVPVAILLKALPPLLFWLLLAAAFAVGVHICGATARKLGDQDPGGIVWDEMVAFWLTVAFIPMEWAWWLAAFVLFRAFDILKPWPIRALERRIKGGLGIMIDDLLAALYAMAVLALARQIL